MRRPRGFASTASLRLAAGLAAAALLAGCAGIADAPLIGVPANAPARPAVATQYMPIHDVPPPREEPVQSEAERAKLQKDLLEARDRQNARADELAKQSAK